MKTTVTKEFKWDMAHLLEEHSGLCQNLHGHTYKMEVTVTRVDGGVLPSGSSKGMIVDFKDLKTIVNSVIVDRFDHATVINEQSDDPFTQDLLKLLTSYGKKVVRVPYRSTAENMAADFFALLQDQLAARGMRLVRLKLWETPTSYAEVCSVE